MIDITVQELKQKFEANEKIILIDVREPLEYEMYNLKGTLIPLGNLHDNIENISTDKNSEIIVHCRSGMRSASAKNIMVANGYTNVRNLIGGILAWQEAFDKI
jgi:rhodanese-related sulfurtransferase